MKTKVVVLSGLFLHISRVLFVMLIFMLKPST